MKIGDKVIKTMGKCKDCKNPNCPKCGTTHSMWECIADVKKESKKPKN